MTVRKPPMKLARILPGARTGRPGIRGWRGSSWIGLLGMLVLALACDGSTGGSRADFRESQSRPLRLFAAASLADVVSELEERWRTPESVSLETHFAGSNLLAQQLVAGAPADLLLSAGPDPMERVVAAGAVIPGSVQAVAGNRLVVVARPGTPAMTRAADLLSFDRLALADPAGVPAGVYARAWLENEGLWARLEGRVVPALDVRAALATVTGGHLPAAVVYATDAASVTDTGDGSGATVVYRVPPEQVPPVVYLLGTVAESPPGAVGLHPAVASFRALLTGAEGRMVFERHGFLPPPETSP